MSARAAPMDRAATRRERFRAAEHALWQRYGPAPMERVLELREPAIRLRVQEIGSGPPILFVHGSGPPGAGSVWAPLVHELAGFRCVMPDLPGAGLSEALRDVGPDYPFRLADLLDGLLDRLDVERAAVIGWSIGGVWSLRLAQRHPGRVSHVAVMGFSPIWRAVRPPLTIRVQSTPIGWLMARLPAGDRMVRSMLRSVVGHGASLDAGRIPDEMIDWIVALMRDTDSLRDGARWMPHLIGPRGARDGFGFAAEEIAALPQPLLYVHGTDDWDGTRDIVERVVHAARDGRELEVERGGHVPWLDEAAGVAESVRRFLAAGQSAHRS